MSGVQLALHGPGSVHDILPDPMSIPVSPGEARMAMWDVNGSELVRQTLGVGACTLAVQYPEDPADLPPNLRAGSVNHPDGTTIGSFWVIDRGPGPIARRVSGWLGQIGITYRPSHMLTMKATLTESEKTQSGDMWRSWRWRLPSRRPGIGLGQKPQPETN